MSQREPQMRDMPVYPELRRLLDERVAHEDRLLVDLAITKLVFEFYGAMVQHELGKKLDAIGSTVPKNSDSSV